MKILQQTSTQFVLEDDPTLGVPLLSILIGFLGIIPGGILMVYAYGQMTSNLSSTLVFVWIGLLLGGTILAALGLRITVTSLIDAFLSGHTTYVLDKESSQINLTRRRLIGRKLEHYPFADIRDFQMKLSGSWSLLSYRIIMILFNSEEIPLGDGISKEEQQAILTSLKEFVGLRR